MIRISLKQLEKLGACEEGKQWFKGQRRRTLKAIIPALLADNHFDYARWLLLQLMTHPQRVQWAIFCAESVLPIFEKARPGDDRPRKAIQAARDFLAGRISAAADAANAAYAAAHAAYDAAYDAAYAAADAANAANAAADAAYAAADAANAAAHAANATYAGGADKSIIPVLCHKALEILGERP